ncbi:unnamed protein product, partial [Ranitomeya imitator]
REGKETGKEEGGSQSHGAERGTDCCLSPPAVREASEQGDPGARSWRTGGDTSCIRRPGRESARTMSGQSITDRITAAQHSVTGSALAKAVCKATTHEVMGPKKKHLDWCILGRTAQGSRLWEDW